MCFRQALSRGSFERVLSSGGVTISFFMLQLNVAFHNGDIRIRVSRFKVDIVELSFFVETTKCALSTA